MLGKISGMLGVRACLIHANETFGKFYVPCPLSAETRQERYELRRALSASARDIRRDVLLWTVHHCHRADERVASFRKKSREARSRGGSGDGECGGRMLGGIYTFTSRGLLRDLVRKHIFDYSIYANGEFQFFELTFVGFSHFP